MCFLYIYPPFNLCVLHRLPKNENDILFPYNEMSQSRKKGNDKSAKPIKYVNFDSVFIDDIINGRINENAFEHIYIYSPYDDKRIEYETANMSNDKLDQLFECMLLNVKKYANYLNTPEKISKYLDESMDLKIFTDVNQWFNTFRKIVHHTRILCNLKIIAKHLPWILPSFIMWQGRNSMNPFVTCSTHINTPHFIERQITFIYDACSINVFDYFEHNDSNVQKLDSVVKLYRNMLGSKLLIKALKPSVFNWFRYRKHFAPSFWSSTKIMTDSKITRFRSKPQIGEMVISNDLENRFRIFTCGLFDKPLNDDYIGEFPWKYCFIGGGSAEQIVSSSDVSMFNKSSDVDLYICTGSTKSGVLIKWVLRRILNWFKTPNTYYCVKSSVVNIYISGISRSIQVISQNVKNPYETLSSYDFSHIRWMLYRDKEVLGIKKKYAKISTNLKAMCTADAAFSAVEKLTTYSQVKNPKKIRLVKALHRGYDIENTPAITAHFSTSMLLENPNGLPEDLKFKIYNYFYPQITNGDEEININNINRLYSLNRGSIIVTDIDECLDKFVVSGDFFSSYTQLLYFNVNTKLRNFIGDRFAWKVVDTIGGTLRFFVPDLTIVSMMYNDEPNKTSSIVLSGDAKFIEWLNSLEKKAFVDSYNRLGVTESVIRRDGYIDANISPTTSLVSESELTNIADLTAGVKINIQCMLRVTNMYLQEDGTELSRLYIIITKIIVKNTQTDANPELEPVPIPTPVPTQTPVSMTTSLSSCEYNDLKTFDIQYE